MRKAVPKVPELFLSRLKNEFDYLRLNKKIEIPAKAIAALGEDDHSFPAHEIDGSTCGCIDCLCRPKKVRTGAILYAWKVLQVRTSSLVPASSSRAARAPSSYHLHLHHPRNHTAARPHPLPPPP